MSKFRHAIPKKDMPKKILITKINYFLLGFFNTCAFLAALSVISYALASFYVG